MHERGFVFWEASLGIMRDSIRGSSPSRPDDLMSSN